MFWTKQEKARYLAREAMEAIKYDRDLEEVMLEALKFIESAERGSGQSGV